MKTENEKHFTFLLLTNLSGAYHVIQVLKKFGIDRIFVLSGGHIAPLFVEAKNAGLKVTDTRDEKNAVFAADAWARLSGLPGVAVVTAGPGLTNTITAVKNTQFAQTPLLILGGATATLLKGRGALQDIDQKALMQPHVKKCFFVKTFRGVIPAIEQAIQISLEGTPGPVFVELPVDILYSPKTIAEWYHKDIRPAKTVFGKIKNTYMRWHLQNLLKGEENRKVIHDKQLPLAPLASEYAIKQAALKIGKAKKPLLVLGSQAMLQLKEIPKLIEAIEKLGIPVYLSGMARGLLGKNHPLQFRHKRKEAIKDADLIILAGLPNDFRMEYGRAIRCPFISVNRNRHDLFLNRKPDLAVEADACHFLIALAAHLKTISNYAEWKNKLSQNENQREKEIQLQGEKISINGINPVALFTKLNQHLSEDAILIADGGDFVATASYILQPPKPLSWLDPGAFGTLGVGGGFAIGAKSFHPNSEVWILWGDGSCAYSLAEFEAMARQGLPVIAIVGNDGAWGQILRDQLNFLGDGVGSLLSQADYHTVAKGYGGDGIRIDHIDQLDSAIQRARESVKNGKPFLINAILADSPFREGSLSM